MSVHFLVSTRHQTATDEQSKSQHWEETVKYMNALWSNWDNKAGKESLFFIDIGIYVVVFILCFLNGVMYFCKSQYSEQNVRCEVVHIGDVPLTPLVLQQHH